MTDNSNYRPPPGHSTAADVYVAQQRAREAAATNNVQAQRDIETAQHAADMQHIVDQGRDIYGTNEFDDISQHVAENFGDRVGALTTALRHFDRPAEIVAALGKKSDHELRALARSMDARLVTQLGKIESEINPGQTFSSEVPAWRHVGPKGRVSNELSRSGEVDNVPDERYSKAWSQHSRLAKKFGWS